MMSVRQMMDRMLEDAVVMPRDESAADPTSAPLNVYEEGDSLIVEAQLPGVKPEDVDVSVERGTLTIRAETKADVERKERNYLVREHRQGSYVRSIRLPEVVDPDGVKASFENGVLRLVFPKSEQSKPRRIAINGTVARAAESNGQQATNSGGTGQANSSQSSSTTASSPEEHSQAAQGVGSAGQR